MLRSIIMALCLCTLSVTAVANKPMPTLDKIVFFGDSLSDNGNIYETTETGSGIMKKLCDKTGWQWACKLVVPLIPKSPPYYQGRFSDGPVWSEELGKLLNLTEKVTQSRNYAYGGARASSEGILVESYSPPLEWQINSYLRLYQFEKGKVDNHLFVIWIGGNDYLAEDQKHSPQKITSIVTDIVKAQIDKLVEYGAKNILILNLPDLGQTPEGFASKERSEKLTVLAELHNSKLHSVLEAEKAKYPNVNLIEFNTMLYFKQIVSQSLSYGITNVTQACFNGGYTLDELKTILAITPANIAHHNSEVQINAFKSMVLADPSLRTAYQVGLSHEHGIAPCDHPNQYLYWDKVHPTSVIHKLLAKQVHIILRETGFQN